MTSGQIVRKLVEQEHRLELGLVQTLNPNTVDLTVLEMLKKLKTATLNLVQVKIKTFFRTKKLFLLQISILLIEFNSRLRFRYDNK